MTVQTLAPRPRRSAEERREHVLAYMSRPHGSKTDYLVEHGISRGQIRDWKAAVADGDLDAEKFPRQTGKMTRDDVAEIRRLQKKVARLEAERAKAASAAEQWEKAADALGKAIDAMHKHGVDSDKDAQA